MSSWPGKIFGLDPTVDRGPKWVMMPKWHISTWCGFCLYNMNRILQKFTVLGQKKINIDPPKGTSTLMWILYVQYENESLKLLGSSGQDKICFVQHNSILVSLTLISLTIPVGVHTTCWWGCILGIRYLQLHQLSYIYNSIRSEEKTGGSQKLATDQLWCVLTLRRHFAAMDSYPYRWWACTWDVVGSETGGRRTYPWAYDPWREQLAYIPKAFLPAHPAKCHGKTLIHGSLRSI